MNLYKVYKHIAPNKKVYIGITTQDPPQKRWNNGYGYIQNKHFFRAIKKYGWNNIEHLILYDNLSEEEAKNKEIELIKEAKSNNPKYGYNNSNGGESAFGCKHSEDSKKNFSEYRKQYIKDNPQLFEKGKNGKHVVQIDYETGEIIDMWKNAYTASKILKCDVRSTIGRCLCGGCIFRYIDENEIYMQSENNILGINGFKSGYRKKWDIETKEKHSGKNNHFYEHKHSDEVRRKISENLKCDKNPQFGKKITDDAKKKMIETFKTIGKTGAVLQLDKGTFEVIKEWDSGTEASRFYGCERSAVRNAIRQGTIFKGYKWRYK